MDETTQKSITEKARETHHYVCLLCEEAVFFCREAYKAVLVDDYFKRNQSLRSLTHAVDNIYHTFNTRDFRRVAAIQRIFHLCLSAQANANQVFVDGDLTKICVIMHHLDLIHEIIQNTKLVNQASAR